jgi:molybdopterin synthase sulfur carrier subunit
MITVEFLGPIGKELMQFDIKNLNELSEVLQKDESLYPWLENSAVAINDVLVKDKNTPLNDGDKVSLLPPVCGG